MSLCEIINHDQSLKIKSKLINLTINCSITLIVCSFASPLIVGLPHRTDSFLPFPHRFIFIHLDYFSRIEERQLRSPAHLTLSRTSRNRRTHACITDPQPRPRGMLGLARRPPSPGATSCQDRRGDRIPTSA